jgi:hypothetical protein
MNPTARVSFGKTSSNTRLSDMLDAPQVNRKAQIIGMSYFCTKLSPELNPSPCLGEVAADNSQRQHRADSQDTGDIFLNRYYWQKMSIITRKLDKNRSARIIQKSFGSDLAPHSHHGPPHFRNVIRTPHLRIEASLWLTLRKVLAATGLFFLLSKLFFFSWKEWQKWVLFGERATHEDVAQWSTPYRFAREGSILSIWMGILG